MRISSINFTPYRASKIQNNQTKKQNSPNFTATMQDFFNAKPGYVIIINPGRINAMSDDVRHLTDVGEHLRTTDNQVIDDMFTVQPSIFGGRSERKSRIAYNNLMPYVIRARSKYSEICTELKNLYQQPTTEENLAKIKKLEKEKLQLDVKADMAMKYTDEVEIPYKEPKIETDEDRAWWDAVMH